MRKAPTVNQRVTWPFLSPSSEWGMPVKLDPGPGPRPVLKLETVTEFSMPNGTVTVVIDRTKGVMDIFAEHEADDLDWELACGLIQRVGLTGDMRQGEYLKGVDVWRVRLKGRQAATVRAKRLHRATGAMGAAIVAMMPLLPVVSPAATMAPPAAASSNGPARHSQPTWHPSQPGHRRRRNQQAEQRIA
jgi:hypothetical protein